MSARHMNKSGQDLGRDGGTVESAKSFIGSPAQTNVPIAATSKEPVPLPDATAVQKSPIRRR